MDRLRAVCVLVAMVATSASATGAPTEMDPALASAVVRQPDVAPCFRRAHTASAIYVKSNFHLTTVSLRNGPRMFVVSGGGSCTCGMVNCAIKVFRRDGNTYKAVLSDSGYGVIVRPDGTAETMSRENAAVLDRNSYRWNGVSYAMVKSERIDTSMGIAKEARRSLTFAPGQSSAIMSADKLARGFEDQIFFDARAGQTATVTVLNHDAHFGGFSLLLHGGGLIATSDHGTLKAKLSATGTYDILVEGTDEHLSRYTMQVTIH